jgi:hypothetical protein
LTVWKKLTSGHRCAHSHADWAQVSR